MPDETTDQPPRTAIDDFADEFVMEFTPVQHRHAGPVPVSVEVRKTDLHDHAKRLLHRFMDYLRGRPMTPQERDEVLADLVSRGPRGGSDPMPPPDAGTPAPGGAETSATPDQTTVN